MSIALPFSFYAGHSSRRNDLESPERVCGRRDVITPRDPLRRAVAGALARTSSVLQYQVTRRVFKVATKTNRKFGSFEILPP